MAAHTGTLSYEPASDTPKRTGWLGWGIAFMLLLYGSIASWRAATIFGLLYPMAWDGYTPSRWLLAVGLVCLVAAPVVAIVTALLMRWWPLALTRAAAVLMMTSTVGGFFGLGLGFGFNYQNLSLSQHAMLVVDLATAATLLGCLIAGQRTGVAAGVLLGVLLPVVWQQVTYQTVGWTIGLWGAVAALSLWVSLVGARSVWLVRSLAVVVVFAVVFQVVHEQFPKPPRMNYLVPLEQVAVLVAAVGLPGSAARGVSSRRLPAAR